MTEQRPMQRWAVTGPTGAGKSLLTKMLAEHGAEIVNADLVGHEILRLPNVRAAIAQAFGERFLKKGEVDRPSMGKLVFAEPEALARLNAIVHPPLARAIREQLDSLAASGRTSLAVIEAAVYFLLPPVGLVDLTISVVAPSAMRLQRLLASGLAEKQASRRIVAQVPMAGLWQQADVVHENTGTKESLARFASELITKYGGAEDCDSGCGRNNLAEERDERNPR